LKPDLEDSRYFEIYNTNPNDTHIKSNGGLSFFGDDTNYLKIDDVSGDVTIAAFSDIILDPDDGGVYIGSYGSDNGVITNGYLNTIIGDTDIINGGTGNSITDVIGRLSIIDSSSFATTGSNQFYGNQTISGSVNIESSLVVSSTIVNSGSIEALNSDLIIDGGDIIVTGSINVSGSIYAHNLVGLISSSAQITEFGGLTKNSGSWTVEPGSGNYSFTLDLNNTYQIWVLGNVPYGIISYNAMVTISNANVPVIGSHNAWYYDDGGVLVFTSIPNQIVTTSGSISTVSPDGIGTNTNTFTFGISNTSEENAIVNYGYVKIS
jgi:hypothetical protein